MRIVLSIIRQTVREALRSKVFHVLLGLTVLATFLLPLTVSGDGTATAAIQAILTYSLQAVSLLLTVAAVWLGCTGLSRDIESHRIHMILTKPVYPWMAWMGKWLGVVLMNGVILLVASGAIFALIQWRVNSGEFDEDDLLKARSEVLTGRQVYEPVRAEPHQAAAREYQRLTEVGALDPDHDPQTIQSELLRRYRMRATEVQPSQARPFRFQRVAVRRPSTAPIFFRYRLYVASTSQTEQRETEGVWRFINPDAAAEQQEAYLPMQSRGGMYHEVMLPAFLVANDGTVRAEYLNLDQPGEIVIFQAADGPTVMVPVAGFFGNYWRGIAVIFLRLGFFAALGCALGAMFSGPVALFLAFAYMLFSIVVDSAMGSASGGGVPAGYNMFNYSVMVVVDKLVVSLREFDIPSLLSNGRLVSGGRIASAALWQVLLRGGPLAALSIVVFSRREMGKVVRQ